MFLTAFNYRQKQVFLGLAKKILLVDDGKIDQDEDAYLRSICAEMAIGIHDEENVGAPELTKVFPFPHERRIVLVEAVALAYSNMDYNVSEDTYIRNLVNLFEMDLEDLQKIVQMMKGYKLIQKQFVDFIAPEAEE